MPLTFLQYQFEYLSISECSLFLYLLNLGLTCDLFWRICHLEMEHKIRLKSYNQVEQQSPFWKIQWDFCPQFIDLSTFDVILHFSLQHFLTLYTWFLKHHTCLIFWISFWHFFLHILSKKTCWIWSSPGKCPWIFFSFLLTLSLLVILVSPMGSNTHDMLMNTKYISPSRTSMCELWVPNHCLPNISILMPPDFLKINICKLSY